MAAQMQTVSNSNAGVVQSYDSSNNGGTRTSTSLRERFLCVITEIRKLLDEGSFAENENPMAVLDFVDTIHCLALSRHFGEETLKYLDIVFRAWKSSNGLIMYDGTTSDVVNVRCTALAFQFLRLHRYPDISSDVFNRPEFLELKIGSVEEVKSVIALLRASRIQFPGETLLQRIETLATKLLNSWISDPETPSLFPAYLIEEVKFSLQCPWPITPERWQARSFIHILCTNTEFLRDRFNRNVLELATLDFNILQLTFQQELCHISSWWNASDVSKLKIFRQRHVQSFCVIAMALFEEEYSAVRLTVTKAAKMVYVTDDMYDECGGTLDQLRLLTAAFKRWHSLDDVDSLPLPEGMITCFKFAINTFKELADQCSRVQGFDVRGYLLNMWASQMESFLMESEWEEETQKNPRNNVEFNEYLDNGTESVSLWPLFAIGELLLFRKYSSQDLHLRGIPLFEQQCATIIRILNDIYGPQLESDYDGSAKEDTRLHREENVVSAVTCLMKEMPGLQQKEAIAQLQEMANEFTRHVLSMYLDHRNPFSNSLKVAWELTRVLQFLHRRSGADEWKHVMHLMVFEPVRISMM